MNPILPIILLAAVAVLGWRGVRRERERVATALKEAEAALQKRQPARAESLTLEKDPVTGVYRPKGGA
jgi:hypothetical protein